MNRQDTDSLLRKRGGKIYYTWDTGKTLLMPDIRASYGHEFLRSGQNIISRLA